MKLYTDKILRFAFSSLVVASILLSVSCSNDETLDSKYEILPENTYPLTFSAEVEGRIGSRNDGKDVWEVNDKIKVNIYGKNVDYTYSDGKFSTNPQLYWETTQAFAVKAWYPVENKIDIDITNQEKGYKDFDFLYAEDELCYDVNNTLHFKHLLSKVVCTVSSDGTVNLKDVKFFGRPIISFINGEISTPSKIFGEIIPSSSQATEDNQNVVYTALLYPEQMYNKYLIVATATDGKTYAYKSLSDKETNLLPGYVHNFDIKIINGEVRFSASGIEAWTDNVTDVVAVTKKYKVTLPEEGMPTEYSIINLSDNTPVQVDDNTFETTTAGFSIVYNPQTSELAKGFIVEGGANIYRLGNIKESSIAEYSTNIYSINSDLKLTYGDYMQIGDYYFSDNTTAAVWKKDGVQCIGIVFHVGSGEGDKVENYNGKLTENVIKGYAVALRDAHESAGAWGIRGTDEEALENKDKADNIYDGYSNTVAIRNLGDKYFYTKISEPLANGQYWAFKVASKYDVSVPESTSGWYLPSIGQLDDIKNTPNLSYFLYMSGGQQFNIENDARYWSSTEKHGGDAWYKHFNDKDKNAYAKSNDGGEYLLKSYVRSVITF